MARNIPSAAEAAQRWQSGFGQAGQRWADGINSVNVAPGVLAAAAKDRYVAGVNQHANKWAANVSAITASEWKQQAISKGQSRLASGATAGAAKYQARIAPVLDAIKNIVGSLPPRGSVEQNIARSSTFQMQLHQQFNKG